MRAAQRREYSDTTIPAVMGGPGSALPDEVAALVRLPCLDEGEVSGDRLRVQAKSERTGLQMSNTSSCVRSTESILG